MQFIAIALKLVIYINFPNFIHIHDRMCERNEGRIGLAFVGLGEWVWHCAKAQGRPRASAESSVKLF
jgi:hypothetical protein